MASGVVSNALFVLLTAVAGYAFFVGVRRRALYDFWGLRSVRKIRVYARGLPATQQIGDTWLASGRALALAVPSAVVPEELNYVLNPAHSASRA